MDANQPRMVEFEPISVRLAFISGLPDFFFRFRRCRAENLLDAVYSVALLFRRYRDDRPHTHKPDSRSLALADGQESTDKSVAPTQDSPHAFGGASRSRV